MGDGPSQTTTTHMDTGPWAPQQSYILDAFKNAQNTYNQNTAQGAYQGDYVAAPTQQQYDAYGNAVSQGYAQQPAVNSQIATGTDNTQAGSAGALGAMSGLGNFANTDQTQGNINSANQYADGMDIQGAVKAGMLNATQNASENTIPNIYRQSAASGGVNSDRAALAQGVVQRGLAQQSAGLEAQLRNAAYTTGIGAAQQDNAQQLAAGNQAGALGLGVLNAGQNGVNSGVANQTAVNAQTTGGANGANNLDQQTLNNLMQQYAGNQNFDWTQLQNLFNIVGKPQGSTSDGTSTVQQNPSLMQNIGSGVGIASALFCDMNIKFVFGKTGGTWRGFPEYAFSYHDDHTGRIHFGPMAQDVEASRPDAVKTIGGMKVILTDML